MTPCDFTNEVLLLLRELDLLRQPPDGDTLLAFDSALRKLLHMAKVRIPRVIRVRDRADQNGDVR